MADLRPFRALRPVPERAAAVAAPPYDVVDVPEARALAAGKPDSFLHVSRPEIDLPDGASPDAVHDRGRAALAELQQRGVTVTRITPAGHTAFAAAAQGVYARWAAVAGADNVRAVEAAVQAAAP